VDSTIVELASPVGKLLSEVEPERVEWLWPGRLPLGKLAVLDGDPGLGKSAVTLDIAARVSAGLELPYGERCGPAGVVLLSAEDGLADTIRPRLDAAEADTERIVALSTMAEGGKAERTISLTQDLTVIERAIGRVGAALVVVDPLMAFLGEKTDSHKDQDIRRALAPLAALAERTRVTVLIVRHLNKAAGGNTLYRGGGSIGIIGAARSGLVVAKDPEDSERRILAANKHNLSRAAPSLVFRVGTAPNGAACVVWGGTSSLNAADILREPVDPEQRSALSEAKGFLSKELADGPVAAELVEKDAGAAGISKRTLKRAKRALGVKSEKESDGS
jgi:RecA-family ATPase